MIALAFRHIEPAHLALAALLTAMVCPFVWVVM